MHGEPIDFPSLKHITFAFAGAVNPATLIEDPNISPFNIGQTIWLKDLTLEQAQHLIGGFGDGALELDKDRPDDRIFWWTGGHPYLTQKLCAELEGMGNQVAKELQRRFNILTGRR